MNGCTHHCFGLPDFFDFLNGEQDLPGPRGLELLLFFSLLLFDQLLHFFNARVGEESPERVARLFDLHHAAEVG
jgi:hypothetical protein